MWTSILRRFDRMNASVFGNQESRCVFDGREKVTVLTLMVTLLPVGHGLHFCYRYATEVFAGSRLKNGGWLQKAR